MSDKHELSNDAEMRLAFLRVRVEALARAPSNPSGYGAWTHHIVPVAYYTLQLAPALGADREIVECAALLHDVASLVSSDLYPDHHIHGARLAAEIMKEAGYNQHTVERVTASILSHRASISRRRESPEAQCLASADGLAHIMAAPSLLYLAYCRHGKSIDAGAEWVRQKLQRSWSKLCPEAQALGADAYAAALRLLAPIPWAGDLELQIEDIGSPP